jgi:hypothetical protein
MAKNLVFQALGNHRLLAMGMNEIGRVAQQIGSAKSEHRATSWKIWSKHIIIPTRQITMS